MAHLISRPSSALEVMAAAPMGATRAEVVVVVPAVASEDMVNVLICLRACDEKETQQQQGNDSAKRILVASYCKLVWTPSSKIGKIMSGQKELVPMTTAATDGHPRATGVPSS
jgi:hypothetical protein